MGKHVLSANIAGLAKQPFVKQTHVHYNDMIAELSQALCRIITNEFNTDPFRAWGCIDTGVGPAVNISAGAVLVDGEIYQADAFVAASVANDIYGDIVTTYATGDPLIFSDNSTHNVHQIKKIVWSDSASGTFKFTDLVELGTGKIQYDQATLLNTLTSLAIANALTITSGGVAAANASATAWTAGSLATGSITVTGGGSMSSKTFDYRYKIVGKKITINYQLGGTLSGTITGIFANMSAFFTNAAFFTQVNNHNNSGTKERVTTYVNPSVGIISFQPIDTSNFVDTTISINGTIELEIV